jgi:hypothetical protein
MDGQSVIESFVALFEFLMILLDPIGWLVSLLVNGIGGAVLNN